MAKADTRPHSEAFSADGLNPATAAVLANAVYLEADWQGPFIKEAQRSLNRTDGIREPIYLIERAGETQYGKTPKGQLPHSHTAMARW